MRKKIYLTFIALLLAVGSVLAQAAPEVKLGDVTSGPGEILVPVEMLNFSQNVNSFTFFITANENLLEFVDVVNKVGFTAPTMTAFHNGNTLAIAYYDIGAGYQPNGHVFDIKFNYTGAASTILAFQADKCDVTYDIFEVPGIVYTDGTITTTQPIPNPVVKIWDVVTAPGEVNVGIEMNNFVDNINSLAFNIEVPSELLTYINLSNIFPGFDQGIWETNLVGDILQLQWFTNGVGFIPAGRVFDITFEYVGGFNTDLVWAPGNDVSYGGVAVEDISYIKGSITQVPAVGTVTIGSTDAVSGNTVSIPVNFSGQGYTSVSAFTLFTEFDDTRLTYTGTSNEFDPGVIVNQVGKNINIAWTGAATDLSDTDVIFLDFIYTGVSDAVIQFLPGSEVSDQNTTPLATQYVNGVVSPTVSNASLTISEVSGLAGQLVSVPVIASEIGTVAAVELTIQFDNSKLTLASFTYEQLAGWTENQTADKLIVAWFDPAGVALNDGALLTLDFIYHGGGPAPITFGDASEISGTNALPIPVNYVNGQVIPGQSDAKAIIGTVTQCVGGTAVVPLTFEDVGQVTSMTLPISFDPAVLTFVDLDNVNPEFAGYQINITNNSITIGWNSVAPKNFDGKVFDIVFGYAGMVSPVSFMPGAEITGLEAVVLDVEFVDGLVDCNIDTRILTLSTTGNGSVLVKDGDIVLDPDQGTTNKFTVFYGTILTLEAIGDEGWEFESWEGSVQNQHDPITTITMINNMGVVANFTQIDYTFDLIVDPAGSGVVTGEGVYNFGDLVEITATANEGWAFVNWTDENDVEVSADANYSFTMPSNDLTYTANFELIDYTFDILVNPAGSGVVTGEGVYNFGDVVDITATANEGWAFVNWTDENDVEVSADANYSFTMPSNDLTYTANFELVDYTFDIVVDPAGSGVVTGEGVYNFGDVVDITATANEGWAFVNWTDENNAVVSADANYSFTMPSNDLTYTANFVLVNYTLTLVADPVAGGTVNGGGSYNFGDAVTIVATPTAGWDFVNWTDDNNAVVSADASYSFTMPSNDLAYTANFELAYVASFPFSEDFEGDWPPLGWGIYDVDANANVRIWTQSTTQNHTPGGSKSAFHNYGPGSQNDDGWLVTPKIPLPAAIDIELSFWSFNSFPTYYGKNSVLISTGNGTPQGGDFVEIWSPASITGAWTETVLDLSSYAGQEVYIAFRYEGSNAHGWYVDDVVVDEMLIPAAISVNPAQLSETLQMFESSVKQLTVTNTGQIDLDFQLTVNTGQRITAEPDTPEDYDRLAARLAADGHDYGTFTLTNRGGGTTDVPKNPKDQVVLRYDGPNAGNAVGAGGATFIVAAYWPASTMGAYAGMQLENVDVYILDPVISATLKVYGQGSSTAPGALLYQQAFSPTEESWNNIELLDPVEITGQDFWVGYEVEYAAGTFPAGVDAGPAIDGFGNWVYLNGQWMTLLEASATLNYNWNIAAYLGSGVSYANDVGVQSLLSPVTAPDLGDETVTVRVRNYGTNPQSNITVSYTLDGGAAVTATIPGPLAPGASIDHTFDGTVDLSIVGQTYVFEACATVAGDENTANDCKTVDVTNLMPVYCDASTTYEDEYIARVQIGTIDNSSGWQGGVADYTDQFTVISSGYSDEIIVTNGSPWASDKTTVWVDWNGDYDFGVGTDEEFVLVSDDGEVTFKGEIAVPAGTPAGMYRMRIRLTYSLNPVPCGVMSYGEVEDYTIKVIDDAPPVPWLSATPLSGTIAGGESMTIDVTFDATDVTPGTYNGSLIFNSNDAANPVVTVPVTLDVQPSELPAPRNLTGTGLSNAAQLAWQAPNLTGFDNLNLTGYNVYRDGNKIGTTGAAELSYMDVGVEGGSYLYSVTAEYGDPYSGESDPVSTNVTVFGPASFPFAEDFETDFPPHGWIVFDVDANPNVRTWTGSTAQNHTPGGTTSAFHNYGPSAQTEDGWLVSPRIPLPGNTDLELRFWNYNSFPTYYEKNSVLISTASGLPQDGDFVEIWSPASITAAWSETVLDLSGYAGEEVYIAFRYEGSNAHAWYLDDIVVDETVLAPIISISPMSLTETLEAGESSVQQLTVSNLGDADLDFQILVSSTPDAWLSASPLSATVAAGDNTTIDVTFDATTLAEGTYTGSLEFSSNDLIQPVVNIPVNLVVQVTNICYPSPRNLTGTVDEQDVILSWQAPDLGDNPGVKGFYDGFESGTPTEFIAVGSTEPLDIAESGGIPAEVVTGIKHMMGSGTRSLLYDNGPFINAPGQGAGGADVSHLHSGLNIYGPNANNAAGYRIADDFVVDETWTIESFTFYAYQTGSGTNSTFTGGFVQIWDAAPDAGGQVIWGDLTTNLMTSTAWTNVYRTNETALTNTDRPIMQIVCATPGLELDPGTYWVDYSLTGSLASGPWAVPITITGQTTTGDAKQFTGSAWVDLEDDGTNTPYGTTFIIEGETSSSGCQHGELLGYNVYRDNVKIGETVVDVRTYIDSNVEVGTYTYGVTAIYGDPYPGESEPVTTSVTVSPLDDPTITVTPAALEFNVHIGGSQNKSLTIGNTGIGDLDWSASVQYLSKLVSPIPVPEGPTPSLNVSASFTKADGQAGGAPGTTEGGEVVILNYDGENDDAIGLQGGGTFYVAARFPSDMVSAYAGYSLESVDVYINDVPSPGVLYIWGAGTSTTTGSILHQQNFNAAPADWNTITLTTPVTLSGQDIWVGYSVTHDDQQWPAGCDAGPAHPQGDWISMDGSSWDHLAGYGLNFSWNIRALIKSVIDFDWLSFSPTTGSVAAGSTQSVTVTANAGDLPAGITYNANILIASNDAATPVKTVPVQLEILEGVDERAMDQISVYPIPANSTLHIKLVEGVRELRMINLMGQIVHQSKLDGELDKTIDLTGLQSGVYTLQFINTKGETYQRTIVISK
ncbi:MAG: choice-of-anchor J domain-containing protein [Bacteroidales bacterium]|nr:choice-of-anchor J domain-containing protein [Bacteroidales bacterium]